MNSTTKPLPNTSWLPPSDEWDFRSVAEEHCRLACLWEYARSVREIVPAEWAREEATNTVYLRELLGKHDLSKSWVTSNRIGYVFFSIDDFTDSSALIKQLRKHADPVSRFLWNHFGRATRQKLTSHAPGTDENQQAQKDLAVELNKILKGDCIYDKQRFAEVTFAEPIFLANKKAEGEDLIRLNRTLLEVAFPAQISRNLQIQRRLHCLAMDTEFARPIHICSMTKVKEKILDRIGMGLNPVWVVDRSLRDSAYVLSVNFGRARKGKIAAALKTWQDKEGKKFPTLPRGKGAALPAPYLRWLAAYRLEAARRKAGVSFGDVKAALKEYLDKGHVGPLEDVLPNYDGHAAWSKAKGDAEGLLDRLKSDPKTFEKRILF